MFWSLSSSCACFVGLPLCSKVQLFVTAHLETNNSPVRENNTDHVPVKKLQDEMVQTWHCPHNMSTNSTSRGVTLPKVSLAKVSIVFQDKWDFVNLPKYGHHCLNKLNSRGMGLILGSIAWLTFDLRQVRGTRNPWPLTCLSSLFLPRHGNKHPYCPRTYNGSIVGSHIL